MEHKGHSTRTRLLCLDVGDRRIGVAVSSGTVATPYTTIQRRNPESDVAAILHLAQREEVGCIIVGMPFSLDGSMGPQARLTQAFCEALKQASPLPVEIWDERFSSTEAERLLRQAGIPPSRNRARLDASAAAVILQSYLDVRRLRKT